jgi:Ca2+-binding RTX toxin-like protein
MFELDVAGEVIRNAPDLRPFTSPGFLSLGFGRIDHDFVYPAIARDDAVRIAGDGFDLVVSGNGIRTQGGIVTGGTLRDIQASFRADPDDIFFYMTDVRIDAGRLQQVLASTTMADDYRLVSDQFGRDDVIFTTNQGRRGDVDVIHAGRGDDYVVSDRGDDALTGGAGHDMLFGAGGNDSQRGGQGRDLLMGGAGRDTLRGDGGIDLLVADLGRDVLFGGAGADRFVFASTGTQAVIRDFQDGVDRILIAEEGLRLADLRIRQIDATTTVVSWDGGSLRVAGVSGAEVTRADITTGDAAVRQALDQGAAILRANDVLDL